MGKKLNSVLFFLISLNLISTGCMLAYKDISIRYANIPDFNETNGEPSRQTLDNIVSLTYNKCLDVKNKELKREYLDNHYNISEEPCGLNLKGKTLGCYMSKNEDIHLNKLLFTGFSKYNFKGESEWDTLDVKTVEAILLHEVMHDVWHQLLDNQKKLEFSIEAEIWYRYLDDDSRHKKLISRREQFYSEEKFFGTEMYSILPEIKHRQKLDIPEVLKKYYEGYLNEEMLE